MSKRFEKAVVEIKKTRDLFNSFVVAFDKFMEEGATEENKAAMRRSRKEIRNLKKSMKEMKKQMKQFNADVKEYVAASTESSKK